MIHSGTAHDHIVAGTAVDRIHTAGAIVDGIHLIHGQCGIKQHFTAIAEDHVIAATAGYGIISATAENDVMTITLAVNHVITAN